MTDTAATGLALLRSPFPDNLISKLPKPTKQQTKAVADDFKAGVRCKDCGGWHHPQVAHLDYVGHAALTHRLLDVDPEWSWEPMAFRDGLPAFDGSGGLWIRLTVLGVSRLGYGHAAGKTGGDPGAREKEVIGDALRNAAMRFGAALDLWHKGDLHADDDAATETPAPRQQQQQPHQQRPAADAPVKLTLAERADKLDRLLDDATDPAALDKAWSLGAAVCADLDMKDPDRLATLVAKYEAARDLMDANPFAREAA